MTMNSYEQEKWNSLTNQIRIDCKRLEIPETYSRIIEETLSSNLSYIHEAGYKENEGFFYICEADRGHKTVSLSGAGEAETMIFLLKTILRSVGLRLELENRDELAKKWYCYDKVIGKEKRNGNTFAVNETIYHKDYEYSVKYDHRKFWFEYIINGVLTIFGKEKAMDLINEYTGLMNFWFKEEHWMFDFAKRCFVEIATDSVNSQRNGAGTTL